MKGKLFTLYRREKMLNGRSTNVTAQTSSQNGMINGNTHERTHKSTANKTKNQIAVFNRGKFQTAILNDILSNSSESTSEKK